MSEFQVEIKLMRFSRGSDRLDSSVPISYPGDNRRIFSNVSLCNETQISEEWGRMERAGIHPRVWDMGQTPMPFLKNDFSRTYSYN